MIFKSYKTIINGLLRIITGAGSAAAILITLAILA